jgi:putative SOS response-associated peptidase YedK
MCGRYGRLSRWERIAQLTALDIRNEVGELAQSYNVAPGTLQPVIINTREGAVLRPLLWGLVPNWAPDSEERRTAGERSSRERARTADVSQAYPTAARLIAADWYYEWRRMEGTKVPHVIQMASREPFLIGGLWDTWHYGKPDALSTFTVLTTEPNELAATVHDRMPLIVAPEDAPRWLDRSVGDVSDLLRP